MSDSLTIEPSPVGEALRRGVASILRWSARNRPRDSGLTITDVWLLGRLSEHPAARMSDLAAWHRVDRSTMTAQVKRLASFGWVERGSDPQDRRAVTARITPEGRKTLEAYVASETATLARVLGGWPNADIDQLTNLLTRFAAALDDEPVDAPRRMG